MGTSFEKWDNLELCPNNRKTEPRTGRGTLRLAALLLLLNSGEVLAQAQQPVLLFTIGMHIEPLGQTAQMQPGSQSHGNYNYNNREFFNGHEKEIRQVTQIVEAHGGRMTIQGQSPFTTAALNFGSSMLQELAQRGHEIALHFHEDAHLGPNSSALAPEVWCQVMQEEIAFLRQASGVAEIRYWSGGNLYPHVFQAASCAGLTVNSDWKNPRSQTTPLALTGVNPWRPSGGTNGEDLAAFLTHDPEGPVVFLPEGKYPTENFASSRRDQDPEAYFASLAQALEDSLAAASPDKVNVFHFTVHPGEFRGSSGSPYALVDQFLTQHMDPLVATGQIRWATLGEMAQAYALWENQQRDQPSPGSQRGFRRRLTPSSPSSPSGHITFAVHVHDWTHPDESAATLTRLVSLFQRYGVRGDFCFTPEITRELATKHPEVIDLLKHSHMTISYHVRPPHPLYPGFDSALRGLPAEQLYATLLAYETYRVNLETGKLEESDAGGYSYVSSVFGRKPVVASPPNGDPTIRETSEKVFRDLGARMVVHYHESGTDLNDPFVYSNSLLVRPSDFSITRTTEINGQDNFWWNFMSAPDAYRYQPKTMLETKLAQWEGAATRLPFITTLIHENNFVRRGEGWTWIYYQNGQHRGTPLPPPWNLNAPDGTSIRPQEEQEAIWAAYEELVAYAAAHLQVVTSEDIVAMAEQATRTFNPAKRGTVEKDVTYCTMAGTPSQLDLFYPDSEGPWPVAVFVHGGGWTSGDKETHAPEVEALRQGGFLVVSVNYRLAPTYPFPAMIEDVKCAVRFLRAHAGEFNLDPRRMGAWGSSAGGHLVSLLGTTDPSAGFDVGEYLDQSSRVQAVVSMYGPTDLTVSFPGGYENHQNVFAGFDPALASPVIYVSPDDPPFFFVHGDKDALVPLSQSEILRDRLLAAGVSAELLVVYNANHGLVPEGTMNPNRQEVAQRIVSFFTVKLEPASELLGIEKAPPQE